MVVMREDEFEDAELVTRMAARLRSCPRQEDKDEQQHRHTDRKQWWRLMMKNS